MEHEERRVGGPTEDGGNDAVALHIPAPQPPTKPARKTMIMPVLLEDGYQAELVLPVDLGRREMLRLRRLLWSLAVPWRA